MVKTDGLHRVTGALTPNSTGDYLPDEMFGGKMSYRRADGAWFIWWNVPNNWIISIVRGLPGDAYWGRTDPSIEGNYGPAGTAVGTATVTEI